MAKKYDFYPTFGIVDGLVQPVYPNVPKEELDEYIHQQIEKSLLRYGKSIKNQVKASIKSESVIRERRFSLIKKEYEKSYHSKIIKTNKRKFSHLLELLIDLHCNIDILKKVYEATVSIDEYSDALLSSAFSSFIIYFRSRSRSEGAEIAKSEEKYLQDKIELLNEIIRNYKEKETLYLDVYDEIDKRLEEPFWNYARSRTGYIKLIIRELIDSKNYPNLNSRFKKNNSNYKQTVEDIRLAYMGYKRRRKL